MANITGDPATSMTLTRTKRKREDEMSSADEIIDGHQPHKKPGYSIYEAANKSVLNNKHLRNMVFHKEFYRDLLRQIQATYNVQQNHWSSEGYGFQIRLLWDHDRLWGTFELGFFKGVFLVDPGPGQDHFQAEDDYRHQHPEDELEFASDTREYPLVWRGTGTFMPGTLLNSPLTVGKIRFGVAQIWGHFDAMLGVGLPNGRCEFHGQKPLGPPVVSLSIQDVIQDWNDHSAFDQDEAPRSSSPIVDRPKDESSKYETTPSLSTTSQELARKDQEESLGFVTGNFKIKSEEVEREWPSMSQRLTIRFHVDEDQEKVWGYFDVGITQGYLLLSLSPNEVTYNTPMEFEWRGRGSETGRSIKGMGEMTIGNGQTVQGVFRGMCGDIDFKGQRMLMPAVYSGNDTGYYRWGWEDYAHGGY